MVVKKYLMVKGNFLDAILKGRKRITIRRRTRLKAGDKFYIHSMGKIWGIGEVTKVEKIMKDEIGDEIAKEEGMTLEELKKYLDRFYGKKNVPLYVIHFRVAEVFPEPKDPEKDVYGGMRPGKIAALALKYLHLDEEAMKILRRLKETDSIRAVAIEMGGLNRRKKVRAILRKAVEMLKEKGVI